MEDVIYRTEDQILILVNSVERDLVPIFTPLRQKLITSRSTVCKNGKGSLRVLVNKDGAIDAVGGTQKCFFANTLYLRELSSSVTPHHSDFFFVSQPTETT